MTRFRPSWKGLGIFPYQIEPGQEILIAQRINEIVREAAAKA